MNCCECGGQIVIKINQEFTEDEGSLCESYTEIHVECDECGKEATETQGQEMIALYYERKEQ